MNELMNKISSYNLFNYLLPGAIFVFFVEKTTSYKLLQENILISAFLVYFIGLVISRIGSLIIDSLIKKFVKHEEYADFIDACKKDNKIELFSEINNMYRTFISLFLVLILFTVYNTYFTMLHEYNLCLLSVFLLILFIASYVKQTKFIIKRIKHQQKTGD